MFLLPAVGIQVLAKVTVLIQQADADQGNSQIGCTFHMVTGQNPQTARINRQTFVNTEFGTEISDQRIASFFRINFIIP